MAQRLKRLPAMRETWVQSLGLEDPLEKEMAAYSSILGWRIPWMEELVGYGPRGHKESDTTERPHFHFTVSYHLTVTLNQNMTFLHTGLFLKRDMCDLFKIHKQISPYWPFYLTLE